MYVLKEYNEAREVFTNIISYVDTGCTNTELIEYLIEKYNMERHVAIAMTFFIDFFFNKDMYEEIEKLGGLQ